MATYSFCIVLLSSLSLSSWHLLVPMCEQLPTNRTKEGRTGTKREEDDGEGNERKEEKRKVKDTREKRE
jgi:hypothetical protein